MDFCPMITGKVAGEVMSRSWIVILELGSRPKDGEEAGIN